MEADPLLFSEYRYFIDLLNEGGYVLDFSSYEFSKFTKEITGIDLLEKYSPLSKGKSLEKFLEEAPRKISIPLLKALMSEWERTRLDIFNCKQMKLANTCKQCLKKLEVYLSDGGVGVRLKSSGFTSEYLDQQRKLLWEKVSSHPTASIGTAKDLVESCCTTILEKNAIDYSKTDDLPKLVDKTQHLLAINPREVDTNIPDSQAVKALLGSLASVAKHLAQLRNSYGTGHGKSAAYKGLTERHARLAAGAALTLVDYLWSTYLQRQPSVGN